LKSEKGENRKSINYLFGNFSCQQTGVLQHATFFTPPVSIGNGRQAAIKLYRPFFKRIGYPGYKCRRKEDNAILKLHRMLNGVCRYARCSFAGDGLFICPKCYGTSRRMSLLDII
jgi:hypothetical protein